MKVVFAPKARHCCFDNVNNSKSAATPVSAFKRCPLQQALSEATWLLTFKIQGLCFGLSDTEMLPRETKFTLGQYCNKQSNFQKLFLVEVSIRLSNTLTQLELLFLNTAIVYLTKASLL